MSLCSNIYYEQVISDLSACRLQHNLSSFMDNIALKQNQQEYRWNYLPWNPMWCTQVSSILASSKRHQLAYFTTLLGYQFPIVWPPVRKKGGQWSFPHRSASNLHGQRSDNRATNYKVGTTEVPEESKVLFMPMFISSVGDTWFWSVKYKLQNTGDCTCQCQAELDI
jgi:hypothetical protein